MAQSGFWTTADEKHKKIAEEFYKGIEITHPDYVSTDRLCPWCFPFSTYEKTSIKYYEYRGPRVCNM